MSSAESDRGVCPTCGLTMSMFHPDHAADCVAPPRACDCPDHDHVRDAYFERNCAYCGCRKGTGREVSIYEVERSGGARRYEGSPYITSDGFAGHDAQIDGSLTCQDCGWTASTEDEAMTHDCDHSDGGVDA